MLKTLGVVVAALFGAACTEEVPSCQQAVTNYYGAGCTFLDLRTNPPTPYTLNESIVDCKGVNSAVPDRCQSYFDDYMFCLDGIRAPVTNATCGSCSSEQDALFGCQ